MNILLLCDEYPPGRHGGIGTAVQLLARIFVAKGHNVVVAGFYYWGYGGDDEFDDEGVKVFRFRPGLSSSFFHKDETTLVRAVNKALKSTGVFEKDIRRSLKRYKQFVDDLIAKYEIDVIEMPDYHDYMRFTKKYVPHPKFSTPTIVKLHGSMTYFNEEAGAATPQHIKQMEYDILQQADEVASVSQYTAARTALYLSYHKTIKVLHNGINIPELTTPVKKEKNLAIFTGSLVEKKGIYQLISAWNKVATTIPDAKLQVYGKGNTTKLKALLSDSVKDTVSFEGHVSREELYRRLASATVGIFPSYAETFGLAAAESMACGTATVFSKLTSGPEIIQDNETGMLVHPDDTDSISAILITLFTNDELCNQLAANGKEYVAKNFDINHVAEQHIKYYQQIITQDKK